MTNTGVLVGGRYLLDRRDGAVGSVARYHAHDQRLDRPVIAWLVEVPEDDPARKALFDLARALGTPPGPWYLRVLDVVDEPDRCAVLLEAPPPAEDVGSDARAAGLVALEAGEALESAAAAGLRPQRLPRGLVYRDEGGAVRLDPVGVCIETAAGAPPAAPVLVARLLEVLLDDLPAATLAGDPVARRLGRVVTGVHRDDAPESLPPLLDALRAAIGTPARTVAAPLAASNGASAAALDDDEPTLRTEEWTPAAAATPTALEDDPEVLDEPEEAEAPVEPAPSVARPPSRVPWAAVIPGVAAFLVIALAAVAIFVSGNGGGGVDGLPRGTELGDSGVPVAQPAAGVVTVGLRAQEDSTLRVTVDGVVEFNGILRAGQRQLWEGNERVQVWTDKGRTMLLSVNGRDLGPYSPAMGHPDWNRIDFGFWPGWGE